MDYPGGQSTRIVKLTGLPEVLRRHDGSARIIDATGRPQHYQNRARPQQHTTTTQTTRATPSPLAAPVYHHSNPHYHHQPSSVLPPQPLPRYYNNYKTYPQFPQPQPPQLPQQPPLHPPPTQAPIHHYHHHPRPQHHQQATSRSCTPNILHPSTSHENFASPPTQPTQRRAASLSPGPTHLIEELQLQIKNLHGQVLALTKQVESIRPTYQRKQPSPEAPKKEEEVEVDDPLADVSMASREYIQKYRLT